MRVRMHILVCICVCLGVHAHVRVVDCMEGEGHARTQILHALLIPMFECECVYVRAYVSVCLCVAQQCRLRIR